jgi:hypothetical protein
MANFFAALLAAAALFQVGIAAPYYPAYNTTSVDVKLNSRGYQHNTTDTPVLHKRDIRSFPIALRRP